MNNKTIALSVTGTVANGILAVTVDNVVSLLSLITAILSLIWLLYQIICVVIHHYSNKHSSENCDCKTKILNLLKKEDDAFGTVADIVQELYKDQDLKDKK